MTLSRATMSALAAVVALAGATLTPAVTYAGKLAQYQSKEKQLKQQAVQTKQNIAQLTSKEQSLQNQLQTIESQINSLSQSVVAQQIDIQKRNAQIAQLQQKIAQTQQELNDQYQVLQQRIRVMYEAGNVSYFDVLFSATSFSDLLDRLQLLSMIAEQDQKILQNIRDNKRQLDQTNAQLELQMVQAKKAYAVLVQRKQQQENAQQSEQKVLSQVHSAKVSAEAALRSENDAMRSLQSLIQQLIAQEGQYTGPAGGWTWPVLGYHNVSSGYGWRVWPDGTHEFHNGIDIPAPVGTPIVAATSGKVLLAGPASGFGDWIVIESGNGMYEIYGHMYAWEIKVSPGEIVHTGQQIAGVGSNGFSTGPHLHFSVATGFSGGYPVTISPTQFVG
ncbi:peptidoglycan DD-metalloendopeptidase family protein [Alicyclobacillus tolerans]|uniref:murein hydrolase activator EnvC family protein n=1 Tax=Alicyclobacillus tolerans TaxID=90970 RepID=UPI001F418EE1|nr:M23 family metallopeptidase [Alicyclobacillus tolerans]MCF8566335.1 peptidoglycan DD-metalloendopeptidase family protein [Alicyclobacillus tolerans]